MAVVTIGTGSSFDMSSSEIFYGNVTQATSSLIEIVAGPLVGDYTGQGFTYSGDAVVGGTVTGYSTHRNGSLVASVSAVAVPATTVYQLEPVW